MTRVGMYSEIQFEPSGNLSGFAFRISLVLRLSLYIPPFDMLQIQYGIFLKMSVKFEWFRPEGEQKGLQLPKVVQKWY